MLIIIKCQMYILSGNYIFFKMFENSLLYTNLLFLNIYMDYGAFYLFFLSIPILNYLYYLFIYNVLI